MDDKSKTIFQNELKSFKTEQNKFANKYKKNIEKLISDLKTEQIEDKLKNITDKKAYFKNEEQNKQKRISDEKNMTDHIFPEEIKKFKNDFDNKIKSPKNIEDFKGLLSLASTILKLKKSIIASKQEVKILTKYLSNTLESLKNKYLNVSTDNKNSPKLNDQKASNNKSNINVEEEEVDDDWLNQDVNFNNSKWGAPNLPGPTNFGFNKLKTSSTITKVQNPEIQNQIQNAIKKTTLRK
ncbi:MAG: hypothetical protein GY830_00615 [Bacteroidetes bacterium]|nr:hypothetical protein [Bacteroidota bacterium]